MKAILTCVFTVAIVWPAAPAAAQENDPRGAPVCVTIDGSRDTLLPADRRAAVLLVARQFELAGRDVSAGNCREHYSLSHIRLGDTITVILAGPAGQREGTVSGTDDLPALYSQLVRAMLIDSSVGAMRVVDRTNVTAAQANPRRVGIDSVGYARLGYGAVLGGGGSSAPAFGFGYRAEMDSFGLDISFLNYQLPQSNPGYGSSAAVAASLLKLEGLYFTNHTANASAYFGGGLSLGMTSAPSSFSSNDYSAWTGSGLQGELTAGYELPRASALRCFVQADAALPFYHTTGRRTTYSRTQSTVETIGHRYNPSIALSVGLGWQRHRR
jgi:hypothetical protein